MTAPQRQPDAGFTLIETLVALAVLAVGGVTLVVAAERHARQTGQIEARIAARWVAENAMAMARLDIEMQPEWQRMLAQDWTVSARRRTLPETQLDEVTILVSPAGDTPEESIVQLTGFLPTRDGDRP